METETFHDNNEVHHDLELKPVQITKVPVMHGRTVNLYGGKRKLQAHAAPVSSINEIEAALKEFREDPEWKTASSSPFAFRIAMNNNSTEETPNNVILCEDCHDEGVLGGGDKLLYLLQEWDVRNILLVISCWDEPGISFGTKISSCESFKSLLECAKEMIENCFMETLDVDREKNLNSARSASSDRSGVLNLVLHTNEFTDNISSPTSVFSQSNTKLLRIPARDETRRKSLEMKNINLNSFSNQRLPTHAELHSGKKRGRTGHFMHQGKNKGSDLERVDGYKNRVFSVNVAPPYITKREIRELRCILKPHPIVRCVFNCMADIIGYSDKSWIGIRDMLDKRSLMSRCSKLKLKAGVIHQVWKSLKSENLGLEPECVERTRQVNAATGKALVWIQRVLSLESELNGVHKPSRSCSIINF